jgi:hypothetical protein
MSTDVFFRDRQGQDAPAVFDRNFPYLPSYHYYRDYEGILAFQVSSYWSDVPFYKPFEEGSFTPDDIKNQFIVLDDFLRTGSLPDNPITLAALRSLREILYYAAECGYSAEVY